MKEKRKRPLKMLSGKRYTPVVCIVGNSGSGKTTLVENLIPELKRRGFRVGTIKHDVHGFEMDKPGKDSWRHKQAGAVTTIISSPYQVGIVMDVDHDNKPDQLMPFLSGVDIILAEGYKRGDKPKIEVFRREIRKEPICKDDDHLVAFISDAPVDLNVPRFLPDDILGLTDFLIIHFDLVPVIPAEQCKAAS